MKAAITPGTSSGARETALTPGPSPEYGRGEKGVEEPILPLIKRTKPKKNRRIPKWVERLIGHVIAMLLFAFVGYLMISHIRPDVFSSILGRHSEQNQQKPADQAP